MVVTKQTTKGNKMIKNTILVIYTNGDSKEFTTEVKTYEWQAREIILKAAKKFGKIKSDHFVANDFNSAIAVY